MSKRRAAQRSERPVPGGHPSRGRALRALSWTAVAALLFGGGFLVWTGIEQQRAPQEAPSADAPLPATEDQVAQPAAAVGPECYSDYCPVQNADTGGGANGWDSVWAGEDVTAMSVEGMAPGSVFVPAALAYAEVRGTDGFSPSDYAGLLSIDVPGNPHRGFWYSGGSPMTAAAEGPGRQGVTALGTHAGFNGHWGAFVGLAGLTGNEAVWTKDWDGNVQRWQVTRVHTMWHTEFPEAYWSPEGPRTLLLTTCGGPAGEAGQYSHNVFVEAVPVEIDGSQWAVAAEEERIQAREEAIAERTADSRALWQGLEAARVADAERIAEEQAAKEAAERPVEEAPEEPETVEAAFA